MKLVATIDSVSWDNMVSEPAHPTDYRVNARLAREAINVGRAAEIMALTRVTRDYDLDGFRINILDAALCHRGDEFRQDDIDSPELYDNINNERMYVYESPKLLCR